MAQHKTATIGDRLNQLSISRSTVARAMEVGDRTVFRWLAYDVEMRLTVSQFVTLCDLLQWNGAELARAYAAGQQRKKKATGPKVAPGQISLLT